MNRINVASATALLLLPVPSLFAGRFAIASGAADNQVFQRDSRGHAAVSLTGTAAGIDGRAVEIRALGNNGPLPNLDWRTAGRIQGSRWSASIALPTGGPYRVELRAGDEAQALTNLLVGDLWILAGQSNMEGVGDLANVELPNGLVHSFDQADRWVLAEEPLHLLAGAADRVHWRKNAQGAPERLEGDKLAAYIAARKKGAGLGLPFAVEMVRRTGVPVGLLPCAHGGTSMDQWSPSLLDQGGDSLYGATIRRVKLAGGKVAGILWYQGESDANPKAAPQFQSKFENLVAAFRAGLGEAELPFYYVQIGRHVNNTNVAEWNQVQEMQRLALRAIPHSGMVPAVDFSLDDGIHVGTQDHKRLGRRLAGLALGGHGIAPVSARMEGSTVRVVFSGVNGRLQSRGRISGFTIHDASGTVLPAIFRADFDPSAPDAVVLHISGKLPDGATLHYGAGKDPYCNVVDQKDMALPVFGPMTIAR
ncbi:MAG: sialate O-acetylesterase [Bryobacterales bacterium]|nr:sialate O-acetylesterase [Bryobacterales bacterium]